MTEANADFYSLSSQQFEEFVANLLIFQGYYVTRATTGRVDTGVDIVANKDGRMIAIEVKHSRKISSGWLNRSVAEMSAAQASGYSEWWMVTSAVVPLAARAKLNAVAGTLTIKIIDGDELKQWLTTDAATKEVERIKKVKKRRINQWLASLLIFGAAHRRFRQRQERGRLRAHSRARAFCLRPGRCRPPRPGPDPAPAAAATRPLRQHLPALKAERVH